MGITETPHYKCIIGAHEYKHWKSKHFKKTGKYKVWEKCVHCGKTRKVVLNKWENILERIG